MTRVFLAVLVVVLVACGAQEGGIRGDDRFVGPDSPKTSPSGAYTAFVEKRDDTTVLVLKDAGGTEVFRDDFAYGATRSADRVGITWLSDRDQLWVLSTDGHSYVGQDSGRWTRKSADSLPDEIKRIG